MRVAAKALALSRGAVGSSANIMCGLFAKALAMDKLGVKSAKFNVRNLCEAAFQNAKASTRYGHHAEFRLRPESGISTQGPPIG